MVIPIIYASTSGNVEVAMEYIAAELEKAGHTTQLHRVEKTDSNIFQNSGTFILATSTWDHGIINPFWDKMLAKIVEMNLSGKKAAFVGLGDFRYETVYFCRGIDTLRDAFLNAGGEQIGVTLKINGDPYEQLPTVALESLGDQAVVSKKNLIGIWTDNLKKLFENGK